MVSHRSRSRLSASNRLLISTRWNLWGRHCRTTLESVAKTERFLSDMRGAGERGEAEYMDGGAAASSMSMVGAAARRTGDGAFCLGSRCCEYV